MRKCCQNYYTYYFSGYIEDCELHEADADNCTQGEQAFVHLSSEKSKIMVYKCKKKKQSKDFQRAEIKKKKKKKRENKTIELGTGFDAYEKIVRLLNGDLKILGGQNYNIEVQEGTLTVATSTITSVTLNEGTLFAEENCTISNFKTLENNVTISGSNFTTITINDASLGSGFHTIGCNVELPNSLSSVDKIKLQNNGSLTLSEDLEINYLEVVDGALNGYNVTVLDSITSDSNTHFRINSGLNLNNINSSYELQFGKIELWEGLYLKNDLQIGDLILYGDNIHPSGDITLNITDLASDTDSNINMNCDLIINGTFSGNKTGSSLTLTSENTIIFGEGSSYNYTGELKLLNSTLEIQKDLTIPNLTLSGSSPTIMGDYGLTIGDLLSINGSGDAYLQTDVTISSSGQLDGNTATGSLIIGDAVNSATLTISSSNANTFGGTIQVNTNNGQIVVHSSQSISCGKFHLHKGNFGGTGTINVSEQLQLTGTVGAPVSIFGTISLTSGFKTPILTDTTTYTIVESTGKIIINTKMTAHYNGTLNLEGTLIIDSTSQINTLKPHVGSTVSGTAQLVVYGSLEFNDQAGSATFSTDLQVSNTLVDSTNIELILSNMTLDIDDTQVIFGKLTTQNGVRILATDITITDTLKHYGENNIDANVNINTGAVLNLQGSSTVTLGSDNSLVIEGSISAASGSLLVIKNNLTIQSTTTQTLNKLELSEPNTNLQCLNALSISSELLLTDNGNKTINCDLTLTGGALIKVSSGTPTLVLPYDKTLDLQNSVIMNLNLNVQNSGTINLSNELGINNLEIAHSSSEITGSYKLTINGLFDFSFATQKSLPELVLNGSAVATASSTLLLTSISFASSFTGAYGGLLKITNNLDSAVGITINELQLAGGSSVTGSGPIIVSSDLTLTNTTTIVIDNDLTISGSVSSTHNTLVQVNSGNLLKFSSGGNSARFVLIGNLENSGSLLEVTTIVLNSSPQILGTSKIKTNQLYFLNTGDKIISTHLEITSTIGDCTEGTLEISDTFNFNDNFTINDLTLSGNGNLTGNSKTITIDNSSNGKFTWSGSNTLLNSMHLSIYGTIESTLTEDTLTINDDSKLTINTASTTSSNVGGKINLSGTLEIDKNMTIGTLIFNSGSQVTGDQRVTVSTNLQLNSGEINFNTDVDSTNTITSSSTETNLIINSSFFRFADDFNIKQLILKSSTISSTSHTIDINTNFQWEGTSTINCQKLKTSSGTIENTAESDKLIINEGKTLEFTSLSSVTDNLQGTIDISGTLKTEIPFTIINLNLDTSGEITGTDKITITNMDFLNTGNKIISTQIEITSTIGDCTEGTLEISDTFNFNDNFTISNLTLSGNGNLIGNYKTITIDNLSNNGIFIWSGSNTLLNSMYLSIYGTIESTSNEDTLTINDDSKLTINTASITSSNVGGGINLSGTLEIDKNMTIGTLIFNSGSQVTGDQRVTVSTNLQLNSGEINFNTDVDSTNTITSSSTETNLIINSSIFRFADDFNIKQLILKSSTISSTSHTIDINNKFQWEGTSTINCQKLKTSSGTIENTAESDKLIINEGKTLEFTSLSSVTDNLQGTIDISGTLKTEIPFTIINLNLDTSGEITGTDKITITNMDFLNTGNKIISTHLEITSTIGDCTEGTLEISDTFNFHDDFTINDLNLTGNGYLTGNILTITNQFKFENSVNINCEKFTLNSPTKFINTDTNSELIIGNQNTFEIASGTTIQAAPLKGNLTILGTIITNQELKFETINLQDSCNLEGTADIIANSKLNFINSGIKTLNTNLISTTWTSDCPSNLTIEESTFTSPTSITIYSLSIKHNSILTGTQSLTILNNFEFSGNTEIDIQLLTIPSSSNVTNSDASSILTIKENSKLQYQTDSTINEHSGTFNVYGIFEANPSVTINAINLYDTSQILGTANNELIISNSFKLYNNGKKQIFKNINYQGLSANSHLTEGILEFSDCDFTFHDNLEIDKLYLNKEIKLTCPDGKLNIITELNLASNNTETLIIDTDLELNENSITAISNRKIEIINIKKLINNGTIKFLSENNEIIGDNNIFENNNKILFKNSNFISDLNFINKGNLTIINSNCTFTNEFNQSQSTNPDLRFYSNENTIVEFNGLTSNFQYGDFEINGKLILQSSTAFNLEYGVTNNIQFNLINSETEIYDNSKIINAYNKIQIGEVLIEMGEIIDSTIEILSKTTLDQSNQKIINSTLILNQLTEIYGSEINLSQDSIIYFQDSDIFVHNDCSFISLDAGNEDCQININSVNNDQNLELLENSNLEINNLKLNFNDLSIITNDNSDFKIVNSRSTVVAQEIEFKGNLTIDNSIIEFLPISNNCNLTNIELIHENSNFTCLEQLNLNGVFEWNEGTLEFSTFNVLADNGYFTINLSGDDKEILNKEILNHHNLTINDNLNENNAAIFRNSKIQNYAYLTLHSKIESDSDQSYIKNNLNSTIDITKNSTILNITMLNLGTLKVEIGNEFPQKLIQEKGEIMLKTSFFNNLKFIDGTITSIGTNYQKIILQKLSWTMGLFEKIQIEIKGQTYLISKNTKKLENSQLFVYGVGSSLIWKEGNIEAGSTSITNEGKFIIENPDEKLYFRKTDTQTSTFKNYGTVKLFSNTDAHLDLVFYNYNEFKMINSQISFDSFYSNYDADVTSSISLNNGTINTEYVFQHNTGELLIEEDSTITSQNIIQLSSNITLERCKLDLSAEKKIKSWSNTFFEMTIEQDPNNFVGFSLQSDEIELLHTLIVNYERTLNSNREINDTYKLIDFVNNDQLTRSDIFTNDANGNSLDYICEDNQYFDLVYNSGDDDDASESGALTDISSRFVGCYVGTYNAGSRIQKCLSCDQGTYTNTYGSSVCSDCQPGSFSDIMGASVCFECDYGHHQNESRATFCDPCDEGYYQDEMGGEYCKECMDGYYAENKTSITCQICKEGSYTEDRTRCIECQAGTYNPTAGKTECLACKAGTAKQSTGAIACDSCFYDEYQDETGQETCKSCPSNTITLSIKSTILEDCICTVNRYGPNGGPCLKCPEGAECFDVGIEIPDAQYGYWHSLENPYEYIECAIDEACPGGEVGKCNNELGYDGSLCSVCMQGFYKMDERCVTCPSSAIWRLVVAVFALLIFTSFLFVVAKKARAYFASFAIAFSFFQVLSVMGSLKLNWPSKITNAFHFLSIFNFNLDILATECSFTVTFYQKWVFIMLSPFTFLVLMIIIYFVAIGHSKLVCKFGAKFIDKFPNFCSQPNYKNRLFAPLYWLRYQFSRVFTHGFSEEDRKELFNNLINSYSCLLTFIYLYVSMKVLQMFQCTKGESSEGDVQYFLTENSEVLCYDSSWYKLLPWVIFFGIIYIIGIPALLLYMLNYYAKNVEDKLFDARLGLLCARYSKEWYYWELVIMTRKLIFIIFECFLNYNPFLQTGLCSLLLLISLLLQLYTQPFLAKRHNTLEFTLLIISQVILLSGMIFVSEDFSEENSRAKLAIAIIFIIWVGVCILGSMIIFEIRHRYRVNIGKDEDELEKAIDLWKGKPIIEFIKNKPSFRHFLTWISLLNKNKLNTTLELYRILNPYLSQIKVKRKSSNDHDQNNYGKGNRDISENKLDDLVIIFNKTYHNHLLSFFHLWYKKNASHLQKIAITKILLSFNNYYYKNNLFMARNSKNKKKMKLVSLKEMQNNKQTKNIDFNSKEKSNLNSDSTSDSD
ncbi:g protein-coupled receptor-related [Anaeramoeba flamelloides]|uniref:G protein-coupled receptor-related n=1 Tax=Anaeramoeba flamelloides TaxID=1746091 RepID=A0ABQ8X0I7_9EUKA|nr:g protein-coupled receptor-related [Anaeramoeba flamelloides]